MNKIIEIIMSKIGWKKLLRIAWSAAYPNLKEKAKGTEPEWDDEAVEIANQIVISITAE